MGKTQGKIKMGYGIRWWRDEVPKRRRKIEDLSGRQDLPIGKPFFDKYGRCRFIKPKDKRRYYVPLSRCFFDENGAEEMWLSKEDAEGIATVYQLVFENGWLLNRKK